MLQHSAPMLLPLTIGSCCCCFPFRGRPCWPGRVHHARETVVDPAFDGGVLQNGAEHHVESSHAVR